MKKLSAVAVAFVMAVSLCACAAQEKGFEPDLSYWSNPKENTDTLPFYYRGNAVSTSADGVDTGGQSLAELIESTALTPVENIDLSKYDIPQHIYQAEFIKYHDTKILPIDKEKEEPVYVIRFYDDFSYMAVFSDTDAQNHISPVYAIDDGTALRRFYQSSGYYITPQLLDNVKIYMEENFSGKGRDSLQPYISDMLLSFFLEEIPEDLVFIPDYNRLYTSYFGDKNMMICGFTDFREDVYSYIVFADIDENGNFITDKVMFMLFTDNP